MGTIGPGCNQCRWQDEDNVEEERIGRGKIWTMQVIAVLLVVTRQKKRRYGRHLSYGLEML